jgi:hypothetical protein
VLREYASHTHIHIEIMQDTQKKCIDQTHPSIRVPAAPQGGRNKSLH